MEAILSYNTARIEEKLQPQFKLEKLPSLEELLISDIVFLIFKLR